MYTPLVDLYKAMESEKTHYWPNRTKAALDNLKLPKISHTTAAIFEEMLEEDAYSYQKLPLKLSQARREISQRDGHLRELTITAGLTGGLIAGLIGYVDLVAAGVFNLVRHETALSLLLPLGVYKFVKVMIPMTEVREFASFTDAMTAIKDYQTFFSEKYERLRTAIDEKIEDASGELEQGILTKARKQLEKAHAFAILKLDE